MKPKAKSRVQKPSVPVHCPRELAARLKAVADRRGVTMAAALAAYGGPGIESEYRRVVKEMAAELEG